MLDHVCAIPQRSSRVTSFRRFVGAMLLAQDAGPGRRVLAQDAGPCAAVAFRQRGLYPVGGALP